jgi:hypothetical protein
MVLNSFRYQIVYDVTDQSGSTVMHGVKVLPDGATPPDFRVGDPWRVELAAGGFLQGKVTVANRKLILDTSNNCVIQYDFTIAED